MTDGRTYGRYRVERRLGQGGMGEVFAATDTTLNRPAAVKLVSGPLAADPEFRTRFRQEAQSAARMSHPTVVRVFDAGEEPAVGPDGEPAAEQEWVRSCRHVRLPVKSGGPASTARSARRACRPGSDRGTSRRTRSARAPSAP